MRRQSGAHLAPLACLLLLVAAGQGTAQPAQECSKTSYLVGRVIGLQGAPGNLTVLDDCSFEVHLSRHGGTLLCVIAHALLIYCCIGCRRAL